MKRLLVLFAATVFLLAGCNNKQQSEPPKEMQPQQQLPEGHPAIGGAPNAVAGVSWTVPGTWKMGPAKTMRVATYLTPAASGDAEDGELGVFFFGAGQGGDVQMNIDRWVSQFENPKSEQSTKEVNGMNVVLVKVAGVFTAPSGPMMQSTGKKENYRLLGAIVDAPEGSVFFKLTGPAKTVAAAEADFNTFVQSLKK